MQGPSNHHPRLTSTQGLNCALSTGSASSSRLRMRSAGFTSAVGVEGAGGRGLVCAGVDSPAATRAGGGGLAERRTAGRQRPAPPASAYDARGMRGAAPRLTAAHGDVRRLVLVDLSGVDVDVHDARARRKRLELARHAVVEAHAERNEQVGLKGSRWWVGRRRRGRFAAVWEVAGCATVKARAQRDEQVGLAAVGRVGRRVSRLRTAQKPGAARGGLQAALTPSTSHHAALTKPPRRL